MSDAAPRWKDPICAVEVGIHPDPFWRDVLTGLIVCDRHRQQYNERDDLGPYEWEPCAILVLGGGEAP